MDIPEQPGPESEFAQILSQTVQEKLYQKKSHGLSFQDAILPVFQETIEFSDHIVRDLEKTGQSPEDACEIGCNYCCHSRVSIIPIEALIISAFIKMRFTETQITALKAGILHGRSLTAGKTLEQIYAIRDDLPCLFLKESKCTIYKVRPSICRSWNSLDSEVCRAAYCSGDLNSSVSASPARNLVFGTTRELFARLSEAFSLQSGTLLLQNAVSDCLKSPDPLGRWSGGHNIFRYE